MEWKIKKKKTLIERIEHRESFTWAFAQFDDRLHRIAKKANGCFFSGLKLCLPFSSTHGELQHTSAETPSTHTHVFRHTAYTDLCITKE